MRPRPTGTRRRRITGLVLLATFTLLTFQEAALAAGGHPLAVEAWMSSPFFSRTIVDPAAGKRFRAIADDYTFWHFAHADPQETLEPNAAGRVADIRVPTLIVAGERDLAAERISGDGYRVCQGSPE